VTEQNIQWQQASRGSATGELLVLTGGCLRTLRTFYVYATVTKFVLLCYFCRMNYWQKIGCIISYKWTWLSLY